MQHGVWAAALLRHAVSECRVPLANAAAVADQSSTHAAFSCVPVVRSKRPWTSLKRCPWAPQRPPCRASQSTAASTLQRSRGRRGRAARRRWGRLGTADDKLQAVVACWQLALHASSAPTQVLIGSRWTAYTPARCSGYMCCCLLPAGGPTPRLLPLQLQARVCAHDELRGAQLAGKRVQCCLPG